MDVRLTNNHMATFSPGATHHGVVCHLDAQVAVAVSVLENHSDLQTQQQQHNNNTTTGELAEHKAARWRRRPG